MWLPWKPLHFIRNVSKVEVLLTITLAVLVCVIGALLLTTTNFFRDFWVFWLCFVMATAQFSLIKVSKTDYNIII